jgi:hypothetical protein
MEVTWGSTFLHRWGLAFLDSSYLITEEKNMFPGIKKFLCRKASESGTNPHRPNSSLIKSHGAPGVTQYF